MPDLSDIWSNTADDQRRRARTARHEAGHAVLVWLLNGPTQVPPFAAMHVEPANPGGVVPGGVDVDPEWFDALEPLKRGVILMAGLYVQDEDYGCSSAEWLDKLNNLDGADGVNDHGMAMAIADSLGEDVDDFCERIRAELDVYAAPLKTMVDRVVPHLLERGVLTGEQFHTLVTGGEL